MTRIRFFSTTIIFLTCCFVGSGQNISFSDKLNKSDFPLFYKNKTADIIVDVNDHEVIRIAAELLAGDIEAVTGIKPDILSGEKKLSGNVIVIGSLDKSELIQKLIER